MENKHIALIGFFELVLIGIIVLMNRSGGVSFWVLGFWNYPNFIGKYGIILMLTPVLSSVHAVVLANKERYRMALVALLGWPAFVTILFVIINYATRQDVESWIQAQH